MHAWVALKLALLQLGSVFVCKGMQGLIFLVDQCSSVCTARGVKCMLGSDLAL